MSQYQPPPQPTGHPQWQQAPHPPQPETYYASQQGLMPGLPPQPKPPSRKKSVRNFVLAIAAIILVASAFGIARNALSSQPTITAPTPNTLATANASSTANALENTQLTQWAATAAVQALTPTAPPVTSTPTTDLGSTLSSGSWNITINSVKATPGGPYDTPKTGDTFLLINFTGRNTGSKNLDMSPIYFTLRDGQGNSFDIAYITVPHDPRGTVVAGQQIRGDLSYEIPKSLHSFTLQFDSPEDFDNSQVVQWNLTV